jgi:hypothetical protein
MYTRSCLSKCIVGEVVVALFAPARQGTSTALALGAGVLQNQKLLIGKNLPRIASVD